MSSRLPENAVTSYQMAGQATVEIDFKSEAEKRPASAPPAVQTIAPAAPAPTPVAPAATPAPAAGFWSRLVYLFTGNGAQAAPAPAARRRQWPEAPRTTRQTPPADRGEGRGGPRRERGEHRKRAENRHHRDRDRDRDRDRNRDRGHSHEAGSQGDRHRQDSRRRDAERVQGNPTDERPRIACSRPAPVPTSQ